jgi:hypothetical protein
MTFHYEQLDPERFQHLCQALVVREFPGTQCFPVGQRDGGRDAVQLFTEDPMGARIFQVKFVRNPFEIDDIHKWLIDIMKDEIPKLQALITPESEIVEYLLLTNVPGTAFPGSGSIDTLNSLLKVNLEVPVRAWWRDDLDRRCEGAADVKWSYPDMLRGTDVLQALAESAGPEMLGARLDTLRTFTIDQYDLDNEVRFQQVDLSNEILNLFVDVPAAIQEIHDSSRRRGDKLAPLIRRSVRRIAARNVLSPGKVRSGLIERENQGEIGAATLLLDDELSRLADLVVLEGGPGQGKSTLAQYVCQVHRMKILGMEEFHALPASHKPNSARFPIKVDLREYATWLAGKNPFGQEKDERRPGSLNKSLESFISYLVSQRTGGRSFAPDDLAAVTRSSALLIVLDGLDEVAEVSLRNDVVKEITAAARRLRESAASLQLLVTTRPSALAEVTDFPPKLFHRWTLARLGRSLIEEYAQRWAKSRRLKQKELATLRRVLNDKLDQPHMRDLARNPMQLAILLTVIHTRGSSLPDKRTALYDIYVELFLAREAEKSETVKREQELIIDVHRYLAWVLHSEAETGRTLGKIESNRLKEVLREYLVAEGRNPDLVNELFTGLAQRVVFLVGAVEGLFEFEVQPLREYFAGRYLYETAPYSPAGNPRKGTKDERFDAVARNTHWLNVTRFYAGCFSKGELPALVDRLEVLCADPDLRLTSHPKALAATLVADWVFSQHPRSLQKTVNMILDQDGYRALLGEDPYAANLETYTLPEGCGRRELVLRCMEVLKQAPKRDVQISLAQLVQKNSDHLEIFELWAEGFEYLTDVEQEISWLWSGHYLGVLGRCTEEQLARVFDTARVDPLEPRIVSLLVPAGHAGFYNRSEKLKRGFLESIYSGYTDSGMIRKLSSALEIVFVAFGFFRFARQGLANQRVSIGESFERNYGTRLLGDLRPEAMNDDPEVAPIANAFLEMLQEPAGNFAGRDGCFERFIERVQQFQGPVWSLWMLSISYVKTLSRERVMEAVPGSLFDGSSGLVSRLLYARKQAGNVSWWRSQLDSALSCDRQVWALAALAFAGPATLVKLIEDIDEIIEDLNEKEIDRFSKSVGVVLEWGIDRRKLRFDELPDSISQRLAALIAIFVPVPEHIYLSDRYLSGHASEDRIVHEALYFAVVHKLQSGAASWESVLEDLKRSYSTQNLHAAAPELLRSIVAMPLTVARKIAEEPTSFPRSAILEAENTLKRELARRAKPLSRIASENDWFSQEDD